MNLQAEQNFAARFRMMRTMLIGSKQGKPLLMVVLHQGLEEKYRRMLIRCVRRRSAYADIQFYLAEKIIIDLTSFEQGTQAAKFPACREGNECDQQGRPRILPRQASLLLNDGFHSRHFAPIRIVDGKQQALLVDVFDLAGARIHVLHAQVHRRHLQFEVFVPLGIDGLRANFSTVGDRTRCFALVR